jgi:ribulose-phosphate 3-epimerase
VSLWSADLLDLGGAIDLVDDAVTGYHLDVFDGHNVADLLFGPDLVRAVKGRTAKSVEVHLNVDDPRFWVDRFAAAGADVISVQTAPCGDVAEVLDRIADRGCRPSLGLELHESVQHALDLLDHTDRILLLGTEIGVKGRDQDSATPGRVAHLHQARDRAPHVITVDTSPGGGPAGSGSADGHAPRFEIVVDGGIRASTVPALAAAGADGIVPGSLVFGCADPRHALRAIAALPIGSSIPPTDTFWSEGVTSGNEQAG